MAGSANRLTAILRDPALSRICSDLIAEPCFLFIHLEHRPRFVETIYSTSYHVRRATCFHGSSGTLRNQICYSDIAPKRAKYNTKA